MMHALGFALLEVMDKEWSVPSMWLIFLVLGVAAAWLARRSIFASLCVASLVVLLAMGQHSELTDPFVGPAIRREAGGAYFVHSYASMAVALALCAGAVAWAALRRGREAHVARRQPG